MKTEFKEQVYQDFLNNRKIILNEDITDTLIELITMQIFKLNGIDNDKESKEKDYDRNDHPIKIYINSSGGSVFNCLSAISAIESSKTPVYTIALGRAMSAGFMILVSGHKRYCQKYSTLLYHQISSWTEGKLENLKEDVKQTESHQKMMDGIITNKTNIIQTKLDEVNERRSDWYIAAEEALKYNIVDEII